MRIQGGWVVYSAVFFEIGKVSSSYSVLECCCLDSAGILLVGSCFGVGAVALPWVSFTVKVVVPAMLLYMGGATPMFYARMKSCVLTLRSIHSIILYYGKSIV